MLNGATKHRNRGETSDRLEQTGNKDKSRRIHMYTVKDLENAKAEYSELKANIFAKHKEYSDKNQIPPQWLLDQWERSTLKAVSLCNDITTYLGPIREMYE